MKRATRDPAEQALLASGAARRRATASGDARAASRRSAAPLRAVLEQRRVARRSARRTRCGSSVPSSASARGSSAASTRRCRSKKPPSPSSSHVETRSPCISWSARVADGREHLLEREARGDGLAHLVERERLAQAQVLGREPLLLEAALHDVDDLFDLERLEDVVVGAALHRVDRRLDRAEAGHDHGERVRARRCAICVEQLDAAHARHLEVADDEVVVRAARARSSARGAVLGRADDVALHAEEVREDVADELLVVDDEDARALRPRRRDRHVARLHGSDCTMPSCAGVPMGWRWVERAAASCDARFMRAVLSWVVVGYGALGALGASLSLAFGRPAHPDTVAPRESRSRASSRRSSSA